MVEILSWDCAEAAEMDEMWSFVQNKDDRRWLWYVIDHGTRETLAYVFGERELNGENEVFLELKALLEPFGITTFYTDGLSTYERNLAGFTHIISKKNTQRIKAQELDPQNPYKEIVSQNHLLF